MIQQTIHDGSWLSSGSHVASQLQLPVWDLLMLTINNMHFHCTVLVSYILVVYVIHDIFKECFQFETKV